MTTKTEALAEIKGYNAYTLSQKAECMAPNASNSPGGMYLAGVRDAVVEAVEWHVSEDGVTLTEAADRVATDGRWQIADDAPSVYTAPLWAQFVDLGAWEQDISEWTDVLDDMTARARSALYVIADRLVGALCREILDADEDDTED